MAMRVCVCVMHVSPPRMCRRPARRGATFGGRGVLDRRHQDGRISTGEQRIARMGRAPSSSSGSASTGGEPYQQHPPASLKHLPHLQDVNLFRVSPRPALPFCATFTALRPPPSSRSSSVGKAFDALGPSVGAAAPDERRAEPRRSHRGSRARPTAFQFHRGGVRGGYRHRDGRQPWVRAVLRAPGERHGLLRGREGAPA
jgi:hypothetical protein